MNFDMSKLMQQAQKMQEQMKKAQQERENMEVTGEAGAGLVKVVMTGKHDVKSVNIDQSLLNEDKEMLEDLIAAAVNSAVKKVEENSPTDIQKMAQDVGINLPDGIKFPF
ncbi:YbaB/EbfC family nucleoid-associated protein [Allofrancisella guangzhouensis]|uniref:Nucleoid-associated protein SD28_06475 n=1 Tax=Allofrancisella guangzhouensis TaxID=594679 RepID=A0A0A8E6R9_9GAMM|nr:YbaB/EbfC family nucleoid-associated protein [Allofrancisella guangzhouensis]AJC49297.1 nucleoid-associated protein [Allofrancisella guangzhouensis]MBK2027194.1 YbaB/EbfC family nucleoid-associated protein [Allofrancisella guangzhouensis]MBK2044630.1 YbaB/EbfC family nucleoid-associated protein [Allofrancisella guangzhouensis]MBK2045087.1 YbaB/EbfC family nucleoid-associated protein [Allofrancisella guangzhouensis]